MIEIIPAIIPQDFDLLKERLDKVVGLVKRVQVDIVDGKYAPTVTWPMLDEQKDHLMNMVRNEQKLPHADDFLLEIDMLVLHPIEYISDLLSIGAKSFVVHIDSTDHVEQCLKSVRDAGCEAGLGLRPSVELSKLDPYLPMADFVQFMGNDQVGYNGVGLDSKVLDKIKQFHLAHPSIPIQIDIGVNLETVHSLKLVGVTRFISGSAIFNSADIKKTIHELQSA
jgi:ribulose-phosphate 3-epimerase